MLKRNYKDTVISIIDAKGTETSIDSSLNDAKHVSAYQRFVNQLDYDSFNIRKYMCNIKTAGTVTGFDISKHIGADGNIVFFHTDVHNSFNRIKSASVIVPKVRTPEQDDRLVKLLYDLKREKFELYIGEVERKKTKGKVIYNRLKYSK